MRSLKLVITLTAIIIISSCNFLIRKYAGVKQPRIENNSSIKEYLIKGGIQAETVLHIDSISSYSFYRSEKAAFTGIEIYNGQGQLVRRNSKDECTGAVAKQLENYDFDLFKPLVINPAYLDSTLSSFEDEHGKKITTADFKKNEFIVCAYYSKYIGKKTLGNIKYVIDPIMNNPDKDRIKVIYLNIDMHECWGITGKDDDRRIVI